MRKELLECTAAYRTVVVASRMGMGGIDGTILGADRYVRQVTSMCELGCAICDGVPKAGLADLGSVFPAAELDLFERCMQVPHVGWVAVLLPAILHRERVRQLVCNYCVDYVQMLLRMDETAYPLCHIWGMTSLAWEVAPTLKANHAHMLDECPAMHALFRAIRRVA